MDIHAHKKTIAALFFAGAALLVLQGIFFLRENGREPKSDDAVSVLESDKVPSPSVSADADTDGDGLPNWKEALLGLNPDKKDSDGDGIGDKDEAEKIMQKADGAYEDAEGAEKLPWTLFPSIEDAIRKSAEEDSLITNDNGGQNKEKESASVPRPSIRRIVPAQGPPGTKVRIEGEGFSSANDVYAGFAVLRDVLSSDGATIALAINPDIPEEGMEKFSGLITYWVYVKNENGLSNPAQFLLTFP